MKRNVLAFLLVLITFPVFAHIEKPISKLPSEWLNQWMEEEKTTGSFAFNFATLATSDQTGQPTTRIIQIMKDEQSDLVFFTHKNTKKVNLLKTNPKIALNIWLSSTKKQVSIEGEVEDLSTEQVKAAWDKMPRRMQLNLMASDHKNELNSPWDLKRKIEQLDKTYPNDIPWQGILKGYKIKPNAYIFLALNTPEFADKFVVKKIKAEWQTTRMQP